MLSVFLFALRLPLGLSCSLYSLGAVYFVFLFSFVCILQLLVLHNTQKALSYCSLDAKVDGLFVLYSIQFSSTHFYCSSFETETETPFQLASSVKPSWWIQTNPANCDITTTTAEHKNNQPGGGYKQQQQQDATKKIGILPHFFCFISLFYMDAKLQKL